MVDAAPIEIAGQRTVVKISIAMATYNGARYLREQLESFITQERLPDELVICDDRSADETEAIIIDFAREAPFPVRLESNPDRLGVAGNFSRALSLCSGDLVFLSDQDDIWMPNKIATMVAAASNDPEHHCFINDAWLTDASVQPVGATKMQRIRDAGLPEGVMVMGCCTVFRSELLRLLLPIPPEQMAHDNWLVQLADLLKATRRLPIPLQYYRRHGANVSVNAVNRLQAPNAFMRIRERGANLVRRAMNSNGMRMEQLFHAQAAQRLHELGNSTTIDATRMEHARETASRRAALLHRRLEIRTLPHLRRLLPVAGLFRDGGYSGPGRPVDAIKDLLVRRIEPA